MTMGFCMVRKTLILTLTYTFFFFGFLSLCYGRGDAAGYLEAYAIPPTPFEVYFRGWDQDEEPRTCGTTHKNG